VDGLRFPTQGSLLIVRVVVVRASNNDSGGEIAQFQLAQAWFAAAVGKCALRIWGMTWLQ
jgi:hypothetical protein